MSATLSVEIPELEAFVTRAREAGPQFKLDVRKALSAAGGHVKREAAALIWSPQGHARKQIAVRVKTIAGHEAVRIATHGRAAVFAQRGSRPHYVPAAAVLQLQARLRKGGTVRGIFDVGTHQRIGVIRATKAVTTEEKRIAYAIAGAIAKRGTQGHPSVMGAALRAARTLVEHEFHLAEEKLVKRMAGK